MRTQRPLYEYFPQLDSPCVSLGEWPTPLQRVALEGARRDVVVKRDDVSSPLYGGNKVRTLEFLFGAALRRGARSIVSTGAFGSNHGVATLVHAPRVGLRPEVLAFPQPPSGAALANFDAMRSGSMQVIPHWSALPFAAWARSRRDVVVMPPGGASPVGAFGYVNAALELAHQVDQGVCPAPEAIVVGVGSTCTTAGLLVGVWLAARRGIGWRVPPRVVAVRVTPWPVTSHIRIVGLASRTSAALAAATGDERARVDRSRLTSTLEVDGEQLGRGYGYSTPAGIHARGVFGPVGIRLDTTYSAKAGAAVLKRATRPGLPLVLWATKSAVDMPAEASEPLGTLARRWRARACADGSDVDTGSSPP